MITESKKHIYRYTVIAVDPAVSPDPKADCTAIIVADVFDYGNERKLVIQPHPINMRMEFPETIVTITNLHAKLKKSGRTVPEIFIEDNGSQKGFVQTLSRDNIPAVGVHSSVDKKARLRNAAFYIQNKQVLFPSEGVDILLHQLFSLGTEKHDDLADACTMLINQFGDKRDSDIGVGVPCDDGGMIINGKYIPPPKKYFYKGGYHTESPEDHYRRLEDYNRRGFFR